MWMWQHLTDQPIRVQVITWCRLARSEYLSQCWPIWCHIKLDDFSHQIIAMTFYLQNRECENAVDYYEMSSYFHFAVVYHIASVSQNDWLVIPSINHKTLPSQVTSINVSKVWYILPLKDLLSPKICVHEANVHDFVLYRRQNYLRRIFWVLIYIATPSKPNLLTGLLR